jgi:hypothetical protein
MARKSNDLYSLLQSRRGGSRRSTSGGGILGWLTGLLGSLSVRRSRADLGPVRGVTLSGPTLAALAFASLGTGYLLGDAFPMGPKDGGEAALRVAARNEGTRPGPIGGQGMDAFRLSPEAEVEPLSSQAYFLAVFAEDQRPKASDLALYLRSRGIDTARPYRFARGGRHFWVTLAYFDGAPAGDELRRKLLQVPPSPEQPEFTEFRNSTEGWPPAAALQ